MFQIQKSIGECISTIEPARVGPDDPVSAAVEAMTTAESDCVLVMDGESLAGIFTERDFLNRVSAEGRDPASTPMRIVMTPEVETLRSTDCVTYAISRMANRGYRNIPVVDSEGRPTGVLDVRIVMGHLIKVFAEIEIEDREVGDAWIDIGGG